MSKKQKLQEALAKNKNRLKLYEGKIMEAEKSFRELNSANMQGVLIQMEDLLDSNHLYAFKNWCEGVVWDGPNVYRHWVDWTLMYQLNEMPDPTGGMRLINQGVKITYQKSKRYVPIEVKSPEDLDPITQRPKENEEEIWLVTIKVPRRLIQNAIEDDYDLEPSSSKQKPKDESSEKVEEPSQDSEEPEQGSSEEEITTDE